MHQHSTELSANKQNSTNFLQANSMYEIVIINVASPLSYLLLFMHGLKENQAKLLST